LSLSYRTNPGIAEFNVRNSSYQLRVPSRKSLGLDLAAALAWQNVPMKIAQLGSCRIANYNQECHFVDGDCCAAARDHWEVTVPTKIELTSTLVIGWKVTKGLDPQYWLNAQAAVGKHSSADVVCVQAPMLANHAVIVAQSGSGKSFFLGRLIEEILLKTKSRVFVLDPNSDFRKVTTTVSHKYWETKSGYDAIQRRGFLPDEASGSVFQDRWDKITKTVYSMRSDKEKKITRLELDWLGISIDILSEDVDPELQNELRHCHDFVKMIGELMALTKPANWLKKNDLLDVARRISEETRGKGKSDVLLFLRDRFPIEEEDENANTESGSPYKILSVFIPTWSISLSNKKLRRWRIEAIHQRAAVYRSFVFDEAERFYFSVAYAVRESGLLRSTLSENRNQNDAQLQVVDLPSITQQRFRLLAVSTLIETEWALARQNWEEALAEDADKDARVPTFIVVDEAHNLIPAEPRSHTELRVREQFRTIAAEGRKFGLFLILVSQRPDKLDPLVLSECENRAIMRLGSDIVLKKTSDTLGLGDVPVRMLERCLEFDVGRALIVGPWASDGPTFLYAAARRTEEGGRNLRTDHWASPASVDIVAIAEKKTPATQAADKPKADAVDAAPARAKNTLKDEAPARKSGRTTRKPGKNGKPTAQQ
jgi:hypothetical protein